MVKHVIATATAFVIFGVTAADAQVADPPKLSKRPGCEGLTGTECNRRIRKIRQYRIKLHKQHKAELRYEREWTYWTTRYIPSCTWVGESGPGPQFASWRYTVPNSGGSGAYGKYQLMPTTYHAFAKYGDWSPLDQEIAAHRLFWAQGTAPWAAC